MGTLIDFKNYIFFCATSDGESIDYKNHARPWNNFSDHHSHLNTYKRALLRSASLHYKWWDLSVARTCVIEQCKQNTFLHQHYTLYLPLSHSLTISYIANSLSAHLELNQLLLYLIMHYQISGIFDNTSTLIWIKRQFYI